MIRRSVCLGAVLAVPVGLAACATPARYTPHYITVYDCSETRETADGRFQVDETHLSWTRDLGDGVSVSTSLSLLTPGMGTNFAELGLSGYGEGRPHILIRYNAGQDERNRWRDGASLPEVASDARLGHWSMRAWLTSDGYQIVPWPHLSNWLAWDRSEAFAFTLYDTAGTRLQGATLPRDGFARAGRTLQEMHARALERFAARETRCRSEVREASEDIVVT